MTPSETLDRRRRILVFLWWCLAPLSLLIIVIMGTDGAFVIMLLTGVLGFVWQGNSVALQKEMSRERRRALPPPDGALLWDLPVWIMNGKGVRLPGLLRVHPAGPRDTRRSALPSDVLCLLTQVAGEFIDTKYTRQWEWLAAHASVPEIISTLQSARSLGTQARRDPIEVLRTPLAAVRSARNAQTAKEFLVFFVHDRMWLLMVRRAVVKAPAGQGHEHTDFMDTVNTATVQADLDVAMQDWRERVPQLFVSA